MKISSYKSYDELPLFLNAELVARMLGVSPSSGYELMHESDFPVLKVGSRGINHALAISIGLIEPAPPKLTLCLCGACADAFRGTGAFALQEAIPGQAEKEICVYCGQRPGMEYVVTPKGGVGV